MTTRRRRWRGVVLSVVALAAAGLTSGFVFRTKPVANVSVEDPPENHLANESSPYLRLHKNNPVDWYPWGAEAFEKAKREDKPIFLSIGYTACYWCHVMERESFSNPDIAKILNEHYVCIKVDREEMPDVDDVYMTAAQIIMNRGGWPLNVFLTPQRKPFYAVTYLPATDRSDGSPGFPKLLSAVSEAWRDKRPALEENAESVSRAVRHLSSGGRGAPVKLDPSMISAAVASLAEVYDPQFAGFGFDPRQPRRPKFPQPCRLGLLFQQAQAAHDERALTMLTETLDWLSRSGLWDHVGGGFHRYSTDRYWRVPHFEKMLYDNALLARLYLEAFELTHEERFRRQADETLRFVLRELASGAGGFFSSLDAESEHEEGKFYVWSEAEVRAALGDDDFPTFAAAYGLTGPANFEEGRYVLQYRETPQAIAESLGKTSDELETLLAPMRHKLFAARQNRARPMLDNKILTDWNGLMIAALADGARLLGDKNLRQSAEAAATVVLASSRDSAGRLLHSSVGGIAKGVGLLEDYAFFIDGLLALHRATREDRWLKEARALADQMVKQFWDESAAGFFRTAADQEVVLARMKPNYDDPVPSGNSAAVRALVALAERTGERRYADLAARTLAASAGQLADAPTGQCNMLRGYAEYLAAGFDPSVLAAAPKRPAPAVVQVQAIVSLDRLQAGREFRILVPIDIQPEWHIYANPTGSKDISPTTLKVNTKLPLDDVKIEYPDGWRLRAEGTDIDVAVYQGRTLIQVATKLRKDATLGRHTIKLTLSYQACSGERCLAPQDTELQLDVDVVGPDEPVRELIPSGRGPSPPKP